MFRPSAPRRIAAIVLSALAIGSPGAHAADPQPYAVTIASSGDSALDAAVKDSATLLSLKDKVPVGGFALAQRARDDADRFQTALRAFGYYDGTVAITIAGRPLDDPSLPDAIDHAPAAPPVPVAVTIQPGPLFHLGQITIQGTLPPGLTPDLGIRQGQVAKAADVLAARDKLLAALREASYPLAQVVLPQAVLHRDSQTIDVTLQADPGRRANLGAIRIEGLVDVKEDFVRRRLLLQPRQPFKPSAIEKAREDLLATGVFTSVEIVPDQQLDANGDLPLLVRVAERKKHAVEVGISYSTDLGAGLTFGWHDRDLFGRAEQLNLTGSVQFGGDALKGFSGQLGAQFIKPDFLARDRQLEVSLSAVRQDLIAYLQSALIQKVGITRKLSDHWSVSLGLLGEEESITQEEITRPYEFVGVPATLKFDSTNSLLDPIQGLRATLSVTPTWSFAHPGGFYTISQLAGSGYVDVSGNGRSVIALRGLVAVVNGAGVFGLPPDQRLYAGGSATVRGYRYQSVGPKFPDDKPTGGTAASAMGIEYRQRFLENWGAAVFLDAGQVSANGAPFASNWKAGAGIGARYYTSFGPIRLDVAVPLNRSHGDDAFELYIGIGQAF
jgi:translocation and assembly module TamA